MATIVNPRQAAGKVAWKHFKELERVLEKRYHLSIDPNGVRYSGISMALQRLGEALLSYYNLNPTDHPLLRKWRFTLPSGNEQIPRLSTIEEMLGARIVVWEDEMPRMQAGHDSFVEGREAGYRPQLSLRECLTDPFDRLRTIVDTTSDQAQDLFVRIQEVVKREIVRLGTKKARAREKAEAIRAAVGHLFRAITYKYQLQVAGVPPLSEEEKASVDAIDLYTFSTMLDARIGKWSLRQALNLSTESLLSQIFGLQEALWGRARALENVEKALLI